MEIGLSQTFLQVQRKNTNSRLRYFIAVFEVKSDLSILNAVFVDQLVSDQTETLEAQLHRMEQMLQHHKDDNARDLRTEPLLDKIDVREAIKRVRRSHFMPLPQKRAR